MLQLLTGAKIYLHLQNLQSKFITKVLRQPERKLLYPTKCRSITVAKLGNLLTYSYEKDDL